MRFLSDYQEEVTVPIVAMVDIVFWLIFFFLVTTNFDSGEKALDLNLPRTAGGARAEAAKSWHFNVLKDGTILLGGQAKSLGEIKTLLKARQSEREEISLVVRGDDRVAYGTVAKLIGLFSEYGYKRMALQAVDERPEGGG